MGERELASADEAFARLDVDALIAHLSAAIRAFTDEGQPCGAAMAAARLGDVFANLLGNLTAARAWFARAWRMIEHEPECLEQGWVAIAMMGCEVDDPEVLLAAAELALDRARRFGDVNLETKALADAGLAHVQAGRVSQGMALLDEGMALACGPADSVDAAAKSVCSFFTACYYSGDFGRAASWAELFRRQGLIASDAPGPVFLSSHCDSVQATLLMELGRWDEAEALLLRATREFEAMMPIPTWHPAIALADLRIRQGRHAEAEALLLGKDQWMQALLPMAQLHLGRGDADLAAAAARRGLRALGDDRLRATELLGVLVDAELMRGDLEAARAAYDALVERVDDLSPPALRARAALAQSRWCAASGDADSAVVVLEDALTAVAGAALTWLHALVRLELARRHEERGDQQAAEADRRAALMLVEGLDVTLPAEPAAPAPSSTADPSTAGMRREGRWWEVTGDGTTVRLADTKGLRYLAGLVARPGVERHVLDMVDEVEGVDPDRQVDRRKLGDAGEMSDAAARRAYRRRVEELRSDADDALARGDPDGAEAVEGEISALVAQLAAAYGVGGSGRPAASAVERARLNVTRALRSAINKLREAHPHLGAELDQAVQTGMYCCYRPADGDRTRWIVQS